jgi:hypothetical protein
VDDPGSFGLVAASRPAEQCVYERAGRVTGAGMDGDPCGLVDHEQVLVLVRDAEVERGGDELERRRRLEFDLLTGVQTVRLRPRRTVDADLAGLEQPLGGGPRADLLEAGEEAVEAQP